LNGKYSVNHVPGILKSLTGSTGFFCLYPVNLLYSTSTPYIRSNLPAGRQVSKLKYQNDKSKCRMFKDKRPVVSSQLYIQRSS
jgi:hypothetical protein